MWNYIFDKELDILNLNKQAIKSIARSVLLPVLNSKCQKSLVLLKLNETENINSIIKRLEYSTSEVYSFCENKNLEIFPNPLKENKTFDNTQFIIIAASRYCASFVWSEDQNNKDQSVAFIVLNSRLVKDIIKIVSDKSKVDFMEFWEEFTPERRENELLNESIYNIIKDLNETKYELEVESQNAINVLKSEAFQKNVQQNIHEINNYLSIIDVNSRIIEKKVSQIDKVDSIFLESNFKNIEKAKQSILNLIENMRNKNKVNLININLKEFILDTINLIVSGKDYNIGNIEVKIGKDIYVRIDKNLTQNTILNLIYNAIEANGKDTIIEIFANVEDEEKVSIYIKNNGEKINEDIVNKIFLEGFTTKNKGMGEGLFISRKNIEKMGGNLVLDKNEKNNVVFKIQI